MNSNIIPFGKYKGDTVDAILQRDPDYLEFLMKQEWFHQKFPTLIQVINNYGSEPSETPEHNKLQTMFLDDKFCFKFISAESLGVDPCLQYAGEVSLKQFEKISDVYFQVYYENTYEISKEQYDDHNRGRGYRVSHNGKYFDEYHEIRDFYVECKPSVGDDYPSVLRQINAQRERVKSSKGYSSGSFCLLIKEYTGVGCDIHQLKKIFLLSGIAVVLLNEICGTEVVTNSYMQF